MFCLNTGTPKTTTNFLCLGQKIQSFSVFVPDWPGRPKKKCECKSISGAGTGRSARTSSLAVSRARAFRRVPVTSTRFVRRQAGPLAHRPRMAATAFSLRGAFSAQVPSGRQGVASSCRIRLTGTIRSSASSCCGDTAILAAILLGTPRTASEYIAGTGDAARPARPLQPTWADVSTISSSTLRRWYASRPPIVLAKHGGRFSQDCRQVHALRRVRRMFLRPGRAICPVFGCAGRF